MNENDILKNKEEFIQLLSSVNREGVQSLVSYLTDKTDFMTSPASTKYHGNYKGGLCEHCLNVYKNLIKLNEAYSLGFNEDSMKLVALLHDLAKINFYEEYEKNVKVDGQWVQEKHYRIKDLDNRFIFGTHEQNSLFIAQQFIPLSIEEQAAIISHHGGLGNLNMPVEVVSDVYNTYKLPMYLHIADLIDAFKHE